MSLENEPGELISVSVIGGKGMVAAGRFGAHLI